ncbi:MAG: dimethylarginine dimethylaminohydrolase family protein [Cyclobacteriaceae bacterium]
MNTTYQSEVGKLKSLLLKSVEDAFVDQLTINKQWHPLNYLQEPDLERAKQEYQQFEMHLGDVERHYLPQNQKVTLDSIYCRDASIATDQGMIICNMGKGARVNEPKVEREMFQQLGIPILGEIVAPGTLEGGDVAWLDQKTLAVGHSYRTNQEGIEQLRKLVQPLGINVLVVPLPHYKGANDVFHLMSVLSPVDEDLAVVFSPLMPMIFRNELLKCGYSLVEVPEEEFESMGCNVLALAPRKCLMVAGNPKTKASLEEAGAKVFTYKGDEISIKGGGGPTCLTRPLLRYRQ